MQPVHQCLACGKRTDDRATSEGAAHYRYLTTGESVVCGIWIRKGAAK